MSETKELVFILFEWNTLSTDNLPTNTSFVHKTRISKSFLLNFYEAPLRSINGFIISFHSFLLIFFGDVDELN